MTAHQTTSPGLSHVIAGHVARISFADLPAATVAATRRALVDGIAVMLAASGMSEEVVPFVATAREMGGPPAATILGHWDRVGAAAAAFANGAMAHALDYEDSFDAAPTHPNASLIPAALAIAQAQGPVTGEELITAVAVGCDLVCRLALSLGPALEEGGWYPPPILGALGAVAAAGRLMRLNPQQLTDAFSLMLCQTVCPGEIKHSRGTVIRAVREAFPAHAAVLAALLAARGTRGFEQPLEGRAGFFRMFAGGRFDSAPLLEHLGESFWTERLSIKPWPCCRGTHAYIEAALELQGQHRFAWSDISRIQVVVGDVQRMLCEPLERKRAPISAIDAKFSIPFTVAAALVHAHVTLDSFLPATLEDSRVLGLAQKVEPDFRSDWGHAQATMGIVGIELQAGTVLRMAVQQALGHPDRPLSERQLEAKFIDCAARAALPWTGEQALAKCDQLLRLERASDACRALAGPDDA